VQEAAETFGMAPALVGVLALMVSANFSVTL
jgi:hypothetical protein